MYGKVPFDWVMFANSFTIYHHPSDVPDFMDQLHSDGVGIINSAVFNAGFLTGGKYFDYRLVNANNPDDRLLFEWREKFFKICNRFSIDPGEACLKFAISAPQINSVALNTSKTQRMRKNKQVLKNEFPEAFWKELKISNILNRDYPYL